ncbi:tyrosine-type recombinase/integrase [Paenibacillus sp. 2TAF8]|uniref:tyrosine-type recombinase/integrase n=1 Tax=Paenibacillus sp. 2TAF8 TaxID=3233020 RepID=UPI003F96D55E
MKVQERRDLEVLLVLLKEMPLPVKVFIEHKLDDMLSPSSGLEYVRDFRIFFNWITPKLWPQVESTCDLTLEKFNDINQEHVEHFVQHLTSSRNLQYSSMLRKFNSLRSLFGFLHQEFDNSGFPVLRRNVFATFIMERPKNHVEIARQIQNKILHVNEIPSFVKFIQEGVTEQNNVQAQWFHNLNRDRDVSIITLLLESGIIVSDIVNLDLGDIDLKDGYLIVTRQQAKVQMSHRIMFGENAKHYLHEYLKIRTNNYAPQESEQALFLAKPNGETHGKRISKRTIQAMVKKYAVKFGASEVTVRQLTHSFGVQYAGTNNVRNMKQQLAQRNIESLEKYLILSSLID